MTTAIETQGLARRFGKEVAVAGVNLLVPEKAVYGFLGQNGAGKTTTIRLLLGLLRPTAGTARIFGLDVDRSRREAARLVGALVETPCHYDHLTGRENLAITRRLLGAQKNEIDRVLETVDLTYAADRRVGGYSLGMRQRLGVARALIGKPRMLLLDEPTNGLDPHGILDMRKLIGTLPEREGVTMFVSSHILAEVEHTATHVGLMHKGRLLLQSRVADLRARQTKTVRLKVDRPSDTIALLRTVGIVSTLHEQDYVLVTSTSSEAAAREMPAINFMLVEHGIRVSALEVEQPSLEDIFLRTVDRVRPDADEPLPLALAA
ncbi:MAG TPA: ABC transporter ATP-binding protein [Allosphingosinicella sp.]|jgi:ABC-2 type transport system ATP-binding protein